MEAYSKNIYGKPQMDKIVEFFIHINSNSMVDSVIIDVYTVNRKMYIWG